MYPDGQNPQLLTDRPQTVDLHPSVLPVGEKILFSLQLHDGLECIIWIMDRDGGDLQQLMSAAALNNIPSFCPAGDLIVFVSNIRGNDNIFIMRPDGSGVQQLTREPDQIVPGAPENTILSCGVLPVGE